MDIFLVCVGPALIMSTCMNFFYSIADQQNFMIVCGLQAASLFLENREEKDKTSKRVSVAVSVKCERRADAANR